MVISYLHKFMEKMLPEEFRPDFHNKKPEDCFQDRELQQSMHASNLDAFCRRRTLSVIKEEAESVIEE